MVVGSWELVGVGGMESVRGSWVVGRGWKIREMNAGGWRAAGGWRRFVKALNHEP